MKELPGEHAATNISTAIQEMLNDWNINTDKVIAVVTDKVIAVVTDKVIAVVTDNAKNMINAISKLDLFKFLCIGHTLQLGIKRAFDVPKVHTTRKHICSSRKTSDPLSQVPKIYVKTKGEAKVVRLA